ELRDREEGLDHLLDLALAERRALERADLPRDPQDRRRSDLEVEVARLVLRHGPEELVEVGPRGRRGAGRGETPARVELGRHLDRGIAPRRLERHGAAMIAEAPRSCKRGAARDRINPGWGGSRTRSRFRVNSDFRRGSSLRTLVFAAAVAAALAAAG